jgi:hypothetical protein
MDLSIIILNYKNKGLTLNCIKSIKEADLTDLKYEIIVIDNASNDNLGEILSWQFPTVKFIQNEKNIGYGRGNNLGLARAQGEYVVIMNPDTLAFPDTFKILYQYMQANPQVGVCGPKQYNPDRSVQPSCYRWHTLLTPFYRRTFLGKFRFAQKDLQRFLMKDFDKQSISEVDWLLGSFLFLRAKAGQAVGYYDPRYFLYFEDTDLCRRMWQKGWQVVYNPEAAVIHNHNRASARTPLYKFFTSRATRAHISSWFKYLHKWGVKPYLKNKTKTF